MKILVYSHDASFYGATKAIFELTNELRAEHNIKYVIPTHGMLEKKLYEYNYEYVISNNPSWLVPDRKSDYSRWNFIKHCVKTWLTFNNAIKSECKKNIDIVGSNRPDLIIVNTSVAPLGIYVAKELDVPCILWIHEPICNRKGWRLPTFFSRMRIRHVLNNANIIIGPSKFLKDYVEKAFHISEMQILPNIIDYNPKYTNDNGKYLFGIVASVSERKGQVEFLESMIKYMPNANVVMYGSGENDYSLKLQSIIAEYPYNAELRGFENDLDVIYSSFDIYVNMGVDETFGRTTIEAMRAGKLVFGRRSGATVEHITHGYNGFLFDDVKDIFSILQEYDSYEGQRKIAEIRQRGREYSMKYEPNMVTKKFMSIINEKLNYKVWE